MKIMYIKNWKLSPARNEIFRIESAFWYYNIRVMNFIIAHKY